MSALRTDEELLVHRELLHRSDDEFAAEAVSYLSEGLARGDALVAVTAPGHLHLLRALFPGTLECHEAESWFETPARTLALIVEAARSRWWAAGRVRVLAEPACDHRDPVQIQEWKRFEALLNVVFEGTPTSFMCAYDLRSIPLDVLNTVRRTHHGDHYTDPAAVYAECNDAPLPSPTDPVSRRGFTRGELPGLRDFTERSAAQFGLEHFLPLVVAVNEVATNIIKHGSGRGALWIWSDRTSVVCDLIDSGSALNDRYLGFIPPPRDRTGTAGMWAVRQICDLVEIRSGPTGTLIRLHYPLT